VGQKSCVRASFEGEWKRELSCVSRSDVIGMEREGRKYCVCLHCRMRQASIRCWTKCWRKHDDEEKDKYPDGLSVSGISIGAG
jgi:hypothetical protein